MSDVAMMAATMCRIHDSGAGDCHRLQTCTDAFAWLAGSVALYGQAVSDLIAELPPAHRRGLSARPLTQEGSSYAG